MRTTEQIILLAILILPALPFAPLAKFSTHMYKSEGLQAARRNIVVLSHNVSQDVADGFFDVNCLLTGRVDVLTRCINSALWVSNGIRKDTSIFLMLFPHNITIEVRGSEILDLNPDERTTALCLQRALLANMNMNPVTSTSTHADVDIDGRDENGSHDDDDDDDDENLHRRQVEMGRLQKTNRGRPETVNPHKPGSLSKSEKTKFRIARKAREAMVRRITRSLGSGECARPPKGFLIHREDTLLARLKSLEGNGNGPIVMLNELGDPLGGVLSDEAYAKSYTQTNENNGKSNETGFDSTTAKTTTTMILGDQIGYAACDEEVLARSNAVRQVSLGPLSLLTSQCITIMHHYLDMEA